MALSSQDDNVAREKQDSLVIPWLEYLHALFLNICEYEDRVVTSLDSILRNKSWTFSYVGA